jgi:hypothetical protein
MTRKEGSSGTLERLKQGKHIFLEKVDKITYLFTRRNNGLEK